MFPLDSFFVTGRPSSRFPHVVVRCRDTDLFVFQRLPQFSNNVTSHVEKRDPGLAFESPGFWLKSAFFDQRGSRIDCVWHEGLACIYSKAPVNRAEATTLLASCERKLC
jgi:hypothetical protein